MLSRSVTTGHHQREGKCIHKIKQGRSEARDQKEQERKGFAKSELEG